MPDDLQLLMFMEDERQAALEARPAGLTPVRPVQNSQAKQTDQNRRRGETVSLTRMPEWMGDALIKLAGPDWWARWLRCDVDWRSDDGLPVKVPCAWQFDLHGVTVAIGLNAGGDAPNGNESSNETSGEQTAPGVATRGPRVLEAHIGFHELNFGGPYAESWCGTLQDALWEIAERALGDPDRYELDNRRLEDCLTSNTTVATPDPAATVMALRIAASVPSGESSVPVLQWDCVNGLEGLNKAGVQAQADLGEFDDTIGNPVGAVVKAVKLPPQSLLFIHLANRWLAEPHNGGAGPSFIQAVWNLRDQFKHDHRTLVLLGPDVRLPAELGGDVVSFDEPLPGRDTLRVIVSDSYEAAGLLPEGPEYEQTELRAVEAIQGLPSFQAEQVTAMSLTKSGLDIDALWERKRQQIEQTPGLKVSREGDRFDDIGGVTVAKRFLSGVMQGQKRPNAVVFIDEIEKMLGGAGGGNGRGGGDTSGVSQDQLGSLLSYMQDRSAAGMIFIGPPGAAKSCLAKAAGNEAGIPTIQLDLGAAKGSLVGQSEQNLRSALKVITSVSNGSTLFLATCNAISDLPPELRRRFTLGTFFFDLPTAEEREAIWKIHLGRFFGDDGDRVGAQHALPNDHGWTGAEIKQCCDIAWRLSCSLNDAAEFVVPVARSAADQIEALRRQADGRFLSASFPGVYRREAGEAANGEATNGSNGRRRIAHSKFGVRKALAAEQTSRAAETFGATGDMLTARKKLIDTGHKDYRRVSAVLRDAANYWRSMTVPFPESGIRLIRRDRIDEFNARMLELREELSAACAALQESYDALRESARQRLGELFCDDDYPATITGEFRLAWEYPSVEPPDYLKELHPAVWERQQAMVRERFETAVAMAEDAFTAEFAKLVSHLTERLQPGDDGEKPKIFRDTAVANLREFFERFKSINVRSNAQLDGLIATAEAAVSNVDLKELRTNDAIRSQACRRIGLELVRDQREYVWFGESVGDYPLPEGFTEAELGQCDHAIRVGLDHEARRLNPDPYEIGVVKRRDGRPGYTLLWDFFSGGYGLEDVVGEECVKLRQSYALCAARRQAQLQGFRVQEVPLEDGGNAPPNDTATLMGEFVAALHQSDLDVENAYQVAYALHTEYDWEPDAELVATLDGWSDVLAAAHEQVVREWVTAHNVLLTRQVGDRVIVRFGGPVAISIERPAIGGEIREGRESRGTRGIAVSIKAMTNVFEHSRAKSNARLLMLAIADFANDEGFAWPSLTTLAKKTLMSRRNVVYVVEKLKEAGELRVWPNRGKRGCNLYALQIGEFQGVGDSDDEGPDAPKDLPPPPERVLSKPKVESGKRNGPPNPERNQPTEGGANFALAPASIAEGNQPTTGGAKSARVVQNSHATGAIAVAPEPSLDPSIDPKKSTGDGLEEQESGGRGQGTGSRRKSAAAIAALLDSLRSPDDLADTDRLVALHALLARSPAWPHVKPGELGLLDVITLAEHCVSPKRKAESRKRKTPIRNPVGCFIARLNSGDFDLTDAEEQAARQRLRRKPKPESRKRNSRDGPVFGCLLQMLAGGGTAFDAVTVGERLEGIGKLEDIGGVPYLEELIDAPPHAAHARHYAEIVRRKAIQRDVIYACHATLGEAYELPSDAEGDTDADAIDSLLARAEQRLFGICEHQFANNGPIGVNTALLEAFESLNERVASDGALSGLSTGFSDVDEITKGLHRDELIIIAARPGMGKTALALNWTLGITDADEHAGVLWFSLEQGSHELAERLVCISCGSVDSNDIRAGALGPQEHTQLMEEANQLATRPIWIDDTPGRTVAEIAALSRRTARANAAPSTEGNQSGAAAGLAAIVVDYLQLIEPDDPRVIREQQVARMTRRLKVLAKELHVPVIVLAQLNRQVEAREDKRPRLSDLRESGAIEQDADVVAFLHRPEAYNPEDNPGLAELIIAKQRGGPKGLEIWTAYLSSRSLADRNRLVVHYAPLVDRQARRIGWRHGRAKGGAWRDAAIDVDDLRSAGMFGLIQAVERFDPARNAKFETYAPLRISGAIRDYLRVIDRLSRSERAREKAGEKTTERLLSLDRHRRSGRTERSHSLSESLTADDPPTWLTCDEEACWDWLLAGLSPRCRLIVRLRYGEDLKQWEIAELLGLSHSRVSALLAESLRSLRDELRSGGEARDERREEKADRRSVMKADQSTARAMGAAMLVCAAAMCVGSCLGGPAQAAPPDPVFRMESPSGCSGGWIHASRQYGLWGATCSHCVSRAGMAVRIRLFKDGHRSPTVNGYCFRAARGHDAAVIYIPPQNYRYGELPLTFNLSPYGPAEGETVFAVGSFAGGTISPAARKVAVTGFSRQGYQFSLNDSAWGGHSGGAVVDEQGNLVGVLWGAGSGYSVVTSSRAIWETLYGTAPRRARVAKPQAANPQAAASQAAVSQAMFSVQDNPAAEQATQPKPMNVPTVKVYATTSELATSGFLSALNSDPQMATIKWRFENPYGVSASVRPRFVWYDGRTNWQVDGWPGLETLCLRFGKANAQAWPVQYCPNCPPGYGGQGYGRGNYGGTYGGQRSPLNPWSQIVPPPPTAPGLPQQPTDDARLKELQAASRKAAQEFEDQLRKLKQTQEDELRKVKNASEDAIRRIQSQAGIPPAVGEAAPAEQSDPFDSAIEDFRERRRRVKDKEQRLKDAAEKIDNEVKPVGRKDWIWPGAFVASVLLGGGFWKRAVAKKGVKKKAARKKAVRQQPTPAPSAADQVERELAQSALQKKARGDTPTARELNALRKIERVAEEKRRWEYYASIPKKHWVEMSGRQVKVINEQAQRYNLPIGDRTISLPEVARALHDLLASRGKLLLSPDESGNLELGGDSPEMREFRKWRAANEKLKYEQSTKQVCSKDEMHRFLQQAASLLRDFGRQLEPMDADAFELFEDTIDDFGSLVTEFFGNDDRDGESQPDIPATPFLGLLYREIDSGRWRRFFAVGSVQSGKTLSFIIPVLYHLFERREDVIFGVPKKKLAHYKWRKDILPVINRTRFRSLVPDGGKGSRGGDFESLTFKNGATLIFMSGSGADEERSSITAPVVVVTELDKMQTAGEVSQESSPPTQLEARTKAFGDAARFYGECTVSHDKGRIWTEYLGGSESNIHLPCPHCPEPNFVRLEREHFTGFENAATLMEARKQGAFFCPDCGTIWNDEDREWANRFGVLVHAGQEVTPGSDVVELPVGNATDGKPQTIARYAEPIISGTPRETDTFGFRWHAAHNLFWSQAQIAGEDWRALRAENIDDAERGRKQFAWTQPVEPDWTDLSEIDHEGLMARIIPVRRGETATDPADKADFITVGLDVAKRWSHWAAWGFRSGRRGHLVDFNELRYLEEMKTHGFEIALYNALKQWHQVVFLPGFRQPGGETIRPSAVWIDSGYAPSQPVIYRFCREVNSELGCEYPPHNVYRPYKGYGAGQGPSLTWYNSPKERNKRIKLIGEQYHFAVQRDHGILLVEGDANYWKSRLFEGLNVHIGEPGALTLCHGDLQSHKHLLHHLTAEHEIEERDSNGMPRRVWRTREGRKSNHFLDACYMGLAAGHFCGARVIADAPLPPVQDSRRPGRRLVTPDGRATAAANPRVLELEAQVRQLEEDKARLELQLDEALAEEGEMVAIPLVACEGYARRAVNMRLSRDQAEQLNQMRAGLNAIDARTEDGKHVDTTSDTVRYLIEEAYIDNADYDDTPSLSKAKLFRTACRKLLMLIPQLSEGDRRKTQFDMLRLENQLNAAERFISTNPPARQFDGPAINTYMEGVRSEYRAAKTSRFISKLKGVSAAGSGADWHYRHERGWLHMLELARHYCRNNHVVKQGIRRLTNNLLQGGPKLDPQTGDEGLNAELAARWKEWAEDGDSCHSEAEHDFHTLETMGFKSLICDGDFFVLPRQDGSLQFVESHRCRTPRKTTRNVIHGVMLDEQTARREQFWFTLEDIDPMRSLELVRDVERINARDDEGHRQVLQVYNPDRFSQRRGVTAVAPIAEMIGMEDDIEFANLIKAQAAASYTIFRELPDSWGVGGGTGTPGQTGAQETETLADGTTRVLEGISPGMEITGRPGEKFRMDSPNVPNPTFFDHTALILTFIAINLDLPVQVLLLDPTKTNFSGWRGAIDQARMTWREHQRNYFGKLHRPVYRWKIRQWMADDSALRNAAARSGVLIFNHHWHPPTFPYIEPLKDAMADREKVDSLLNSPRRVVAERGADLQEIHAELLEDNTRLIVGAIEAAQKIAQQFPDVEALPDWREILRPLPADPARASSMTNTNLSIDLQPIQRFGLDLDQYFGLWAVEEQRFLQMFEQASRLDLASHVSANLIAQSQRDPDAPAVDAPGYLLSAAEGQAFVNLTEMELSGRDRRTPRQQSQSIALIDIRGTMTKRGSSLSDGGSTIRVRRDLRAAAADSDVGGILLRIDSPGGSVAGTADLGKEIARARQQKPVYAFCEDLCASAGYWIACQADKVFANDNTALIGSIGTYIGLYDLSGMAAQQGIKAIVLKSSELKGTGFEGAEITAAQQAYLQEIVDKTQAEFSATVASGRKLSAARVAELADGRVHMASDAKSLGLVDAIESFDTAVAELRDASARRQSSRTQAAVPHGPDPQSTIISAKESHVTTQTATQSPQPATIQEIKSACPGIDNDFAVKLLESSATVDDCRTRWMAEQQSRLDAREKELEDARNSGPKPKPGVDPTLAPGSEGGAGRNRNGRGGNGRIAGGFINDDDFEGETGDPVADFGAAVAKLTAGGMERQQAAVKECPSLPANAALAPYLRVKLSGGYLTAAGATDEDIGTLEQRLVLQNGVTETVAAIVPRNATGTRKMVAAGAITQYANVYGAASGKIDDVSNENFIGIALDAASGDGSIIEVLTYTKSDDFDNLGAIDSNVVIDEDFVGDWPAAATGLTGQGRYSWTKTETNGLGVTSSDQSNGVLKFAFDAVAEAATATLFMENSPVDPTKGGYAEFILAVYDIGDDAALDIDFGLASDDHATDFESVAEFVAFHLDGSDLSLKIHSDDGTTDTAAVDTTVDLVDDTFYAFKIDYTDLTDVKFYYRALGTSTWTRLLSGTTFDVSDASANWTPIVMVEKTSNDTTADVRLDRCRVQAVRDY
eukprot:g26684.t1